MKINWKIAVMRTILNGLAIAITAFILPTVNVLDKSILTYFFLGGAFGLLNAFVKPVVQFLTLSFLFVTYGLVIIIINSAMMLLLEFVLPDLFFAGDGLWVLVGGTVMGFLGMILENMFGLTPPIIDETLAVSGKRSAERTALPRLVNESQESERGAIQ